MKTRLHDFIGSLRAAGVRASTAETLDAVHAIMAIGIEANAFREALAATLVKDEADRPTFDEVFAHFFAAPPHRRGNHDAAPLAGEGEGHGSGKPGMLPGRSEQLERQGRPSPQPLHPRHTEGSKPRRAEPVGRRLAHERSLKTIPFRDMSARYSEECEVLVRALALRLRAYLARRQRRARRGRLDVRRTIRQSISHGGVPIEPAFRRRRPGRPDLIVLCDYSHSVVTAANFLLALLLPAHDFFRRVRLFAFVDRPVEVSIENSTFVPHDHLDLYARSDLGKVLVAFYAQHAALLTRNTLLLVLGDGRNNRRPPRADVLAQMHGKVRQLVWLNPEPVERWNTGDSAMRAYARHCDMLLAAADVASLHSALKRALRDV